jgi:HK97 family phage prohead protease
MSADKNSIERRAMMDPPVVRAGTTGKIAVGYAALFDSDADIGGYWIERIAPGAFTATIGGDVRALVDHDSGRVIGRTTAGTLRLAQDAKGLAVEIELPDTSDGRDMAVQLELGNLTGMSFGFVVTKQSWDETISPPVRTIQAVELHEVSIVAFPAYEATEVALRSSDAVRTELQRRNNYRGAAQRLQRKATHDQRMRGLAGR